MKIFPPHPTTFYFVYIHNTPVLANMGSALTYLADAAVTTVHVDEQTWPKSEAGVRAAAASMQGWRRCMEDSHFLTHHGDVYLFGVFDGHGGSGVSRYCAKRLPELVFKSEHFKKRNYDMALHEAFMAIDLECQEPAVQEELLTLHLASRKGLSPADQRKVEIHIAFETLLELFLGHPGDPVNNPPDPFKVFQDEYYIPNPFEIVPPEEEAPASSADDASGSRKRKRRNATTRYGARPPVHTAEPRSPWGVIASKIRQLAAGKGGTGVISELKDLMGLVDAAEVETPLLRLKKKIDWSDQDAIIADPLSAFFEGTLHPLFHRTGNCDTPWVYSIHPVDLMVLLQNNHLTEGPARTARRCVSDDQGCTATVCLLSLADPTSPMLYCANAGDSRSILVRNGRAVPLSIDHKPSLPAERRRVIYAGGKVLGKLDPRVQGDLNLSRAIGDWRHKQNPYIPLELQMISPRPDITITELRKEDEFLVLGCDGVWERFSSSECAALVASLGSATTMSPKRKGFLRSVFGEPDSPKSADKLAGVAEIATKICQTTIRRSNEFPGEPIGATIGCDNMSAVVVRLGRTITDPIPARADSDTTTERVTPVFSYGAQIPDDWKPAGSGRSSPASHGKKRKSEPPQQQQQSSSSTA